MPGKREGLRHWELALLLAVAAAALVGARLGEEQRALSDKVIRLHVVANSDSAADQALKYKVRDAVLAQGEILLAGADREEALEALETALPKLGRTAAAVVAEEGYDYPVRLRLGRDNFSTRTSGAVTLPAGEYTALRVEIGAGAGQNWWGVVFPTLCLDSVTAPAGPDSLTPGQLALITGDAPEYQVKFKVLELLERWRERP